MNRFARKVSLTALVALLFWICSLPALAETRPAFQVLGAFSLQKLDRGCYRLTDGLGRTLTLVPRGQEPPPGTPKDNIIRTPVKRVAVVSGQDVSIIHALGAVDTVVVVTGEPVDWSSIPYIKNGLQDGSVIAGGKGMVLDYELFVKAKPELVLTWDEAMVPVFGELSIPVLITNTERARDLDTQMQFARFLGPIFDKTKQANAFIERVRAKIAEVKTITQKAVRKPKVMWVDLFPRRLLAEPGNSFHAEIVRVGGGQYLFDDIFGAS